MEILLSCEIHRRLHVGFSDHLIYWQAHLAGLSIAQGSFSLATLTTLLPNELDSYCWLQVSGPLSNDTTHSISVVDRNTAETVYCCALMQ